MMLSKVPVYARSIVLSLVLGTVATGLLSSTNASAAAIRGVDRSGITLAQISDATQANVTLGGTSYDLSSADITRDGVAGGAPLVGEIAVVVGVLDVETQLGTADTLAIDTALRGAVEAISNADGELSLMGTIVKTDAATLFAPPLSGLEQITVSDSISVSGHWTSTGELRATRVSISSPQAALLTEGIVSDVDLANSHFQLGELTVDFSSASLGGFDDGSPQVGDVVEVSASAFASQNVLQADSVDLEQLYETEVGLYFELEGLVASIASTTEFSISGVTITITAGTEFIGGTATDIALDSLLEVEGELDAQGHVVAEEVVFLGQTQNLIGAPVERIITAGSDFLIVLGLPVQVTPDTVWVDDSDAEVEPFALSYLNEGDYVELILDDTHPSGRLRLHHLERQNAQSTVTLRGLASEVNTQSRRLTMMGVTVVGVGPDAVEFFADVQAGDPVELTGRQLANGLVLARELKHP